MTIKIERKIVKYQVVKPEDKAAAGKPPGAAPVAASSAAPGVDHAAAIGIRYFALRPIPAAPMAIDSAISPRSRLRIARPHRLQPLEDHGEGRREADEGGDDPGCDRLRGGVLGHRVGLSRRFAGDVRPRRGEYTSGSNPKLVARLDK